MSPKDRSTPRPWARAPLAGVQGIFSDVDGTLTVGGLLPSRVVAGLEALRESGLRVVLVTGRPAGWADCWARNLPVDGVVAENGGLYLAPFRGGWRKVYAQPEAERRRNRARLKRAMARAMDGVRGARWSSDSAYTEVALALDHCEEVRLPRPVVRTLERRMRAAGLTVARSSIHLNAWVGSFDKAEMVRTFLRREWGETLAPEDPRFVYVGDSLNDAPMFAAFSRSVGVANVRSVLAELDCPPAFITRAAEGDGFLEVVRRLLVARGRRAR